MSTCSIAYGIGKDTSANFVVQLRDASDVTRMLRQRGTKMNYQILGSSTGKNSDPIGGISHTDLYDMSYTTQSVGPSNALLSTRGYMTPQCSPCGTGNFTPFNTLRVSVSLIRY
jgi:hypothetical protein